MNLIFEGFLVVVSTGIETPLEFLFSSFLSLIVVVVVGVCVVLTVVVLCVVVVGVVDGLLKMAKGVTFGFVNVGCDFGVTGKGCDLGVTGFRLLKLFGRI